MKISKKILSLVLVMLLAIAAFAIPASAATYPTSAVTLNIHKYALPDEGSNDDYIGNDGTDANPSFTAPSGATALDGVTFKIYKVGGMTTTQPASYTPSAGDLKATVTTQNGGLATFTVQPADFGLYYVEETDAPASVTTKSVPFFVYLPSTNAAGTDWLTTVNVYPKNLTTLGNTTLTKTVNTAAYDSSAVSGTPTFVLVDEANSKAVVTFNLASTTNATASYVVDSDYPTVAATVSGGVMSVTGLPVGTYHWEETVGVTLNGTELPKAANSASFTIDVNGENNNFSMDNSAKPTISKVADVETQTIGKDVVWTLTPSIPKDIASYKEYKITDTIPAELDFAGESAVAVEGLTKDTHYTLTVTGKTVTVDVNAAGRTALAAAGAALTIKITTQINANAVVGEEIVNNATLNFKNQYDVEGSDEDSDSVKTGGALFTKVDAATSNGLAGAVFELQDAYGNQIAVSATDADAGEFVVNPASNSYNVTSGEGGKIYIKGLAYGNYQLVEVKAPTGYQLVTAPISFTVSADSATTALTIQNVPQPDLPLTGGMGTMLFTIIGLALIGGGAFFFFRSRKSKKEEN